jgi:nucleotidyltransferase substrate binding protein (TIGR01987 family)
MVADIRWHQRFSNYQRALGQLSDAVALSETRALSELEKQGLIQAFEYTHELAWNCLKDFLEYQGQQDIYGSRDATRKAFQLALVEDGEGWMDMIGSRNRSSYTYNRSTADNIADKIISSYFFLFKALEQKLTTLKEGED